MTYAEKLNDPRWQKKRLEVFQRDDFKCVRCLDRTETLHVHHKKYFKNRDPWDYDMIYLVTLCSVCHKNEHPQIIAPPKYNHLIPDKTETPVDFINGHISILSGGLHKEGITQAEEEEILKKILELQQKRKEYLNG